MSSQSKIRLSDSPAPSASLLALLHSHLPRSLPLLRRLQFAAARRSTPTPTPTPHAHVLLARYWGGGGGGGSDDGDDDDCGHGEDGNGVGDSQQKQQQKQEQKRFAAAYVDLSRAPETQCWLFSTLEGAAQSESESESEIDVDLVLALLRRARTIAVAGAANGDEGPSERWRGRVLVGSLHEAVRQGLLARGVRMEPAPGVDPVLAWEFCGKWLFRVEELPPPLGGLSSSSSSLPAGMRWDRVRREDIGLVLSRTSIARQEATLLMLPSLAVRLDDGTPIAWAFLGLDGTIITLHVEEPYRRRGLAKALACKLMREHLGDYGDDGWGAADVFELNHKSQALCKSIGGKLSWTVSWAMIDMSTVGDPM